MRRRKVGRGATFNNYNLINKLINYEKKEVKKPTKKEVKKPTKKEVKKPIKKEVKKPIKKEVKKK